MDLIILEHEEDLHDGSKGIISKNKTLISAKKGYKMRKSSFGKSMQDFREITPFYMQHSYSHFRHDEQPEGNKPGISGKNGGNRKLSNQERRLSVLHQKLFQNDNELYGAGKNVNHARRRSDESLVKSKSTDSLNNITINRGSIAYEPNQNSFKKFSSNLLSERRSSALDDSIQKWHKKSVILAEESNPKKVEESETEDKDKLPPINQSNKIFTVGNDETDGKKQKTFKTHSYQDPIKAKHLQDIIKSRLRKGYTIKDLVNDPSLEDILDLCDEDTYFPAYDLGEELNFEQYQALRKCKYLRVSDTNIASLREAAIKLLNEENLEV